MEPNLIEEYTSTPASSFQPCENRVIRAATFFAEGARFLHEESFDLLNLRQAARLRLICNAVQQLVPALQRIGRATKPEVAHRHSAPQFSAPDPDTKSRSSAKAAAPVQPPLFAPQRSVDPKEGSRR
jgi:hypothetical protein